ncbi:hypothetical protein vseg_003069 [Gypsophila vaccaria]
MGKSPGKWIKTVIFGKKPSKSTVSRGKEKSANGREVNVHVMAPESGTVDKIQEVTGVGLNTAHVDDQNSNSEYREPSFTQQEHEISEPGDENADNEATSELYTLTDEERITQAKAATKTQAAFRGYLARRAFKALKGIIRLQALIRGHLVRRQAVATLYCVIGIVKLQALVRGSRIRCSDSGIQVQRVCIANPLDLTTRFDGDGVSTSTASFSANAFIAKLLAPSPEGMPLRVQYDETDSNSVQIWLERWSISCPWKPVSPPKKAINPKIQKKQGNSQAADCEIVKPKRSVRKVPSVFDNTSTQSASEPEKQRRIPKKVLSHPADSVQENPQNELEKVKRSLRKVHSPVAESTAPAEPSESPQFQAKTMSSSVDDVVEPNEVNPVENNIKEESIVIVKEEVVTALTENKQETIESPVETDQPKEMSNDEKTKVNSESFECDEKDENTPVPNGEAKPTEESMLSENQKASRRASFSAKQELEEDGSQNTPKVPSYMQATQSAKAKLRGQGSPRLSQDSAEKNNINVTRRHSLPSPANGKASSASPRTSKSLQSNGKGGNKTDKSLLSSRDGTGKATQGWRR